LLAEPRAAEIHGSGNTIGRDQEIFRFDIVAGVWEVISIQISDIRMLNSSRRRRNGENRFADHGTPKGKRPPAEGEEQVTLKGR
jgi:hypothetical protein